MIKAILFDFDGTIINSLPFYVKAYKKSLKKFNINFPSDKEVVKNCFSKKEEIICKNLNIKDVDTFKKTYFNEAREFYKKAKLFPDVLGFIKFARKRKIKLAIITFAYSWYIDKMIKNLHLKKYFDIISSSDNVKNPKPHPEIAIKACRFLKTPRFESLVIGDSKSDIFMGKAAGCQTALFFPDQHKLIYDFNLLKKTKPDYIFNKFNELTKII